MTGVQTCALPISIEDKAPEAPVTIERIVERIVERPLRRRLPDTRASITHRFNVAGHEGYLTVGLYQSGSPGELFITMSKEGSTIGGLMDCLGTAISVALQYGVPIESLVKKFEHQRFEPMGMTTSADIPFAKSLVDYIFRWLGMEFIPGYREANAPKRTRSAGHDETKRLVGEMRHAEPTVIDSPADGSRAPSAGRCGTSSSMPCTTYTWINSASDTRCGYRKGSRRCTRITRCTTTVRSNSCPTNGTTSSRTAPGGVD